MSNSKLLIFDGKGNVLLQNNTLRTITTGCF